MENVAYCGLNCNDCLFYKSEMVQLAAKLKQTLEQNNFSEYAAIKRKQADANSDVVPFHFYTRFVEMLTWLSERGCEQSCRDGSDNCGFGKGCVMRQCAIGKGIDGCWDCEELDSCPHFGLLRAVCEDAPKKNAQYIRDFGMELFLSGDDRLFYRWNMIKQCRDKGELK